MRRIITRPASEYLERRRLAHASHAIARLAWRAGRLPLLALLVLLEPVVRGVLSFAMVLVIIAAIVFELSAVGPGFSFLGALVAAVGLGLVLFGYYGVLTLLSR